MTGNVRGRTFDYEGDRFRVLDLGYNQIPEGLLGCQNLRTHQVLVLYEFEVENIIDSSLFDDDELYGLKS